MTDHDALVRHVNQMLAIRALAVLAAGLFELLAADPPILERDLLHDRAR